MNLHAEMLMLNIQQSLECDSWKFEINKTTVFVLFLRLVLSYYLHNLFSCGQQWWFSAVSSASFLLTALFNILAIGMQIALVLPLTSRGKCSVPTVEKLRRDNGFMQVVAVPYRISTWMIGLMMKTYMIWAMLKW